MVYKNYDYKKAKSIIKQHSFSKEPRQLVSASLGMAEDWNWTGETIWENGEFTRRLIKGAKIAGINKSYWATPILELEFEDDFSIKMDCYFETEE